jgi:hypothetical protein
MAVAPPWCADHSLLGPYCDVAVAHNTFLSLPDSAVMVPATLEVRTGLALSSSPSSPSSPSSSSFAPVSHLDVLVPFRHRDCRSIRSASWWWFHETWDEASSVIYEMEFWKYSLVQSLPTLNNDPEWSSGLSSYLNCSVFFKNAHFACLIPFLTSHPIGIFSYSWYDLAPYVKGLERPKSIFVNCAVVENEVLVDSHVVRDIHLKVVVNSSVCTLQFHSAVHLNSSAVLLNFCCSPQLLCCSP